MLLIIWIFSIPTQIIFSCNSDNVDVHAIQMIDRTAITLLFEERQRVTVLKQLQRSRVHRVCWLTWKKRNIHSKRAKKKVWLVINTMEIIYDFTDYWLLNGVKEQVMEIVFWHQMWNGSLGKNSVEKCHKHPAKYCLLNIFWSFTGMEHNRSYCIWVEKCVNLFMFMRWSQRIDFKWNFTIWFDWILCQSLMNCLFVCPLKTVRF